jgi:predicted ATPase
MKMAQMNVLDSPRLRIVGYRRIRDMEIALRPLTVLIGANGVGKTSFLEVMSLLAESAKSNLKEYILALHGINSLVTYDAPPRLTLEIAKSFGKSAPLEYTLILVPTAQSYSIEAETLTQERGQTSPFIFINSRFGAIKYFERKDAKLLRPTWEHDPLETSLAQVPKMFEEPESFRRFLSSSTIYHVLDVSPRAPVRLPQQMRPSSHPGNNGENLTSYLYYLREARRNIYESIEDTLRAALPGFVQLDFPPVAAGTLTFTLKDRSFTHPLYPHQLSEGTLRFLWLVALLHSPELPAITLLDEPEVSLHPELLIVLSSLFREASHRTQLIVATHADSMVRFLVPEELAVMDLDETGGTKVTWADSFDVEEWMKEYSLDELWRMGRIGGGP